MVKLSSINVQICVALLLISILHGCAAATRNDEEELYYGLFPSNFMWSSATSAYQIEGAWDADGKGVSIWDTFAGNPDNIEDGSNGSVACDSYKKYEEDVQLLENLGVGYYRFSISWSRVLPNGTGEVNQAGIDYYKSLIEELLAADIQPQVTLYHWDLPQVLEDQGGWLNDELIIDAFEEYSRLCFTEFGPNVKFWITINEPWIVSWLGYGVATFAPGKFDPAENPYIVSHNLIKAHARAYHVYDTEFREDQGGQIGITLNGGWSEPKDPRNADDITAAERNMQFEFGWYAHPIFVNGDYPDVMKFRVLQKSMAQGYNRSRLPEFTEEEKQNISGTSDFFGLNFYSSALISSEIKPDFPASYDSDKDIKGETDPSWPPSGSDWLWVTPFGMRKVLHWISERYGYPPILVTENGVSDTTGTLEDEDRIYYYKHYINNVLQAIDLDGCDVIGYTAWSLMDNFEWGSGYTEKFGLHYVDFEDPKRPRTAKDSVTFLKQLIEDNGFPEEDGGTGEANIMKSTGCLLLASIIIITWVM